MTTPTWPAIRKRASEKAEAEAESFPPLQAFPPLQPLNNNTADGSRSGRNSRSRSRSSRGGSTTTHPSKVSSLITQAEENVVKEMAGLLLGNRNDGKDDDHYSDDAVRPQVLFGDANGSAACGGAGVGIAESDEEGGAGRLITSPWDLPAPFMLSATGLLAASGAGSSGDNASTMPKQQQQQQQQQNLGKGAPSSSFFSFSANSPARRRPPASGSADGNSNTAATAADGLSMTTTTTPAPNQHNALQHQAHQPLPPEMFRNHQYHLNINNGGIGGAGAAYDYGGGAAPHRPVPLDLSTDQSKGRAQRKRCVGFGFRVIALGDIRGTTS